MRLRSEPFDPVADHRPSGRAIRAATFAAGMLSRLLVLGGCDVATRIYLDTLPASTGSVIGAGLLFFGAVVVIVVIWSVIDAVWHGFWTAVAIWVVIGALVAVYLAARTTGWPGADGGPAILAELRGDGAFVAWLVGLPALFGIGLAAAVRWLDRN